MYIFYCLDIWIVFSLFIHLFMFLVNKPVLNILHLSLGVYLEVDVVAHKKYLGITLTDISIDF